jgi:hypothetical protein
MSDWVSTLAHRQRLTEFFTVSVAVMPLLSPCRKAAAMADSSNTSTVHSAK